MRGSSIQWCDDTENPVMGCDLCELWNPKAKPPVRRCYAGILHETRGRNHPGYARRFERPETFPGRMARIAEAAPLQGARRPDRPWLDLLPRLIFVSDMGDALSPQVGFEYLESEVIDVVGSGPGSRHRWLWLTKRPHTMATFSRWLAKRGRSWPTNLWAGTSITSDATYHRVVDLLKVGGKSTRRFLSVEPQSTPVDLSPWLPRLDWVIQGGESGTQAHAFHLEWARDLKGACNKAGVPYFLKQLGRIVLADGKQLRLTDNRHGGNWLDWPTDLRVRQVPMDR
jgi:protein gp37